MRLKYFGEFVNEGLNKKDIKQQLFNHDGLISDAWRKVIKEAQKFQNINFDLENNEVVEQRTFTAKVDLRKDQPVKYEVNLALCEAGGDWEEPVMYFKVQFVHDYGILRKRDNVEYAWDVKDRAVDSNMHRCYALIPGPDINPLSPVSGGGYTAYTNERLSDEGKSRDDVKITDQRMSNAWKWIEELFNKLVTERHQMLD